MQRMPAAVTLQLANDFLHDDDAVAMARSSRVLLSPLRRYRIKRDVTIEKAVALSSDESNPDGESSSSSQWRIGRVTSVEVGKESLSGMSPCESLQSLLAALPPSVTQLRMECNEPLDGCILPPKLASLDLCWSFNHPLAGLLLPASLTRFRVGPHYDQPLPPFPDSLRELELGAGLQQPPPPTLPQTLIKLIIGQHRDAPQWSGAWPAAWNEAGLHTLHIHSASCDLSALRFPASLTELHLCLPPSFDLASRPMLPGLKRLQLSSNQPFVGSLALHWPADARLESIDLSDLLWQPKAGNDRFTLPPVAVADLKLPLLISEVQEHGPQPQPLPRIDWPAAIEVLEMSLSFFPLLYQGLLPPFLQQLHVLSRYAEVTLQLDQCRFPTGLTKLEIGWGVSASIPPHADWPPHLTRLDFDRLYDHPLDKWQPPPSLTEIRFHHLSKWNRPTMRCPDNLRILQLGEAFNQPLEGLQLPPSLTQLMLGNEFNQSLQPLSALPHLRLLVLPAELDQPLSGANWTLPSLHELRLLSQDRLLRSCFCALLQSLPPGVAQLGLDLDVSRNAPVARLVSRSLHSLRLRPRPADQHHILPASLLKSEGLWPVVGQPQPLPATLQRLCIRLKLSFVDQPHEYEFDLTC